MSKHRLYLSVTAYAWILPKYFHVLRVPTSPSLFFLVGTSFSFPLSILSAAFGHWVLRSEVVFSQDQISPTDLQQFLGMHTPSRSVLGPYAGNHEPVLQMSGSIVICLCTYCQIQIFPKGMQLTQNFDNITSAKCTAFAKGTMRKLSKVWQHYKFNSLPSACCLWPMPWNCRSMAVPLLSVACYHASLPVAIGAQSGHLCITCWQCAKVLTTVWDVAPFTCLALELVNRVGGQSKAADLVSFSLFSIQAELLIFTDFSGSHGLMGLPGLPTGYAHVCPSVCMNGLLLSRNNRSSCITQFRVNSLATSYSRMKYSLYWILTL